jgi:hypothetical protein
LQSVLSRLPAAAGLPSGNPERKEVSFALQHFVELVEDIRAALAASTIAAATPSDDSGTRGQDTFTVIEERVSSSRTMDLVFPAESSRPVARKAILLPFDRENGQPLDPKKWKVEIKESPGKYSVTYAPLNPPLQEPSWLQRRITLEGLDVLATENAWAELYVSRNEELIPKHKTAAAFVYRTSPARFGAPLIPSLRRIERINFTIPGAPQPLTEHFEKALSGMLEGVDKSRLIQAQLRYASRVYETVPPGQGPEAFVPIVMTLPTALTLQGIPSFAQQLADRVRQWYDHERPPRLADGKSAGEIVLALTVFASLTRKEVPILRITNLRLMLSAVSDL